MADEQIKELMRQAPFSFVGTVEHLGGATMAEIPVDDRTAVVRVEQVLHAPEAFTQLEGQRVTVQLSSDVDPPAIGDTEAFFATGLAFGESVAVTEFGRLAVADVAPRMTAAAEAGKARPFDDLAGELDDERIREHAAESDAIVVGKVTGLEKAVASGGSEHDPDWWRATLDVQHVERGDVQPGELAVLYPNSLDVRWYAAPKPRAGEEGVWVLHATEGGLKESAPFQILHYDDLQPVQSLETLRGNKG
jgi:hypothetical protein